MSAANTVLGFATELDLVPVINRAISYDPSKLETPRLWQVPVSYNHRLKNSAGRANLYGISLHPGLKQATRGELVATFLHELAHVMDCLTRGHSGHDYGWQEAMVRLGQNPIASRYHNIASCRKSVAKPGRFDDLQF